MTHEIDRVLVYDLHSRRVVCSVGWQFFFFYTKEENPDVKEAGGKRAIRTGI
jgi:hypothetical protein